MLAAPEVISQGNTGNYDGKAVDVWACGVMLFVMLFCQYPFERPEDEQEKIQTKRYQMVSSTCTFQRNGHPFVSYHLPICHHMSSLSAFLFAILYGTSCKLSRETFWW